MKKSLLMMGLAFVFACSNNNSNNTSSANDSSDHSNHTNTDNNMASSGGNAMMGMHNAMNNMMQQMQTMKPTGDPDYDFAMMMMHHHQGAIEMAKSEVANGTDETIKGMAQKMIEEQQKEVDQFSQFMQRHQPSGNSDFGQKAMSMMTPMSDIKMEGSSLDAMFASMMIPHHQDAVKMSQEYLKVGKNEELKKMAKSIMETQPRQIQELQQWLSGHKS